MHGHYPPREWRKSGRSASMLQETKTLQSVNQDSNRVINRHNIELEK